MFFDEKNRKCSEMSNSGKKMFQKMNFMNFKNEFQKMNSENVQNVFQKMNFKCLHMYF